MRCQVEGFGTPRHTESFTEQNGGDDMTTFNLSPNSSVTVRSEAPEALEVEAVYAPGGSAPPKHFHPAQAEHFEVQAGSVTARVDGEERVLEAGDRLDIPAGAV